MTDPYVPISSGGEGNTITSPPNTVNPAKRWCFTLNNYTEEQRCSIISKIKEKCSVGIVGKEIAPNDNKTPHLQGYIEFKVKSRPKGAFGISAIHWEKAKGTRLDSIHYCSKEDKNAFSHGCVIPRKLKLISPDQLYWWQKDIIKLISDEPDERKIYWYWSLAGATGKTSFSKYLTFHHGAVCFNGRSHDIKNGILDYYNNQGDTPRIVILPVPRCWSTSTLNYEALENIKDMYFYSGKYEGGMICSNPPHLIVFANEPPDESRMSSDRWHIVQIDGVGDKQQAGGIGEIEMEEKINCV